MSAIGLVQYDVHKDVLKDKNTKKLKKITMIDDSAQNESDETEDGKLNSEKLKLIQMLILIKDESNISDRAYSALASISDLPSLYTSKSEMEKASTCIPFDKTPRQEPGIERDLEEVVKLKIKSLADQGKVGREDNKIHVKIRVFFTHKSACFYAFRYKSTPSTALPSMLARTKICKRTHSDYRLFPL